MLGRDNACGLCLTVQQSEALGCSTHSKVPLPAVQSSTHHLQDPSLAAVLCHQSQIFSAKGAQWSCRGGAVHTAVPLSLNCISSAVCS